MSLVHLLLVPILVFFFLKDRVVLLSWFADKLPAERPLLSSIWVEMNAQMANYVRGKAIEIFIISVVSYAVFAGFGREIRKPIFLMQSHLTLRNFESDGIIEDPDEILTALHQKGVEAAATYDGPVLVQRSRQIETKMVRGIAPKADGTYPFLNGQIVSGELSLGDH